MKAEGRYPGSPGFAALTRATGLAAMPSVAAQPSGSGPNVDLHPQPRARRQGQQGVERELVDLAVHQIIEARLRNAWATRGPGLRGVPAPHRVGDRGHDIGSHRHDGSLFRTVLKRVPDIGESSRFHCGFPRLSTVARMKAEGRYPGFPGFAALTRATVKCIPQKS